VQQKVTEAETFYCVKKYFMPLVSNSVTFHNKFLSRERQNGKSSSTLFNGMSNTLVFMAGFQNTL
jgi:hypothetical protein